MFTLNCKGRLLIIDEPVVMGIINITPDSFYAGSRNEHIPGILKKAEQMLSEGATILDIGGQSTRPGSEPLAAAIELERIIEPIKAIHQHFPKTFISVDTFYPEVASAAIAAGASIINDVSGGNEAMFTVAATSHVPYVCMHTKGTSQTMQQQAVYDDVTKEVLDYFNKKIYECKRVGLNDIIIDPGFGFAKTITQNFKLLKELSAFTITGKPLLAGVSRKSTIYKTLDITPEEAMNGTTVLHTIALQNGASILRAHDVKEAVEAIKLFTAYRKA